jgi:glutamate-1-semialdehyde aminotransferase
LDNNKYVDMSHTGVGACILGVGDADVDAAVLDVIKRGSMSTLNSPDEVELAELLIELHPWAEMARFARCGGEAMAVAARIVRASTGKDVIAFCGYHGWNDWYLAANLSGDKTLDGHLLPGLSPRGVPRGLKGTMLPFRYNQLQELEKIVAEHGGELAGIIMETIRNPPNPGFLEGVRAIATKLGIPLVFDEVTSGFRLNTGGIHMTTGVMPDMAVFAKALGNGYPMAAIIGKKQFMSAAQETFISSTYWTERIGPAAALAMIKKHRAKKVHEHLIRMGTLVSDGWKKAADAAGVNISTSGIAPLSHFGFEHEKKLEARTLFIQTMLEKGFLSSTDFYATYAHTEKHVDDYLKAVGEAFTIISKALSDGDIEKKLKGPVSHTGFHRLT